MLSTRSLLVVAAAAFMPLSAFASPDPLMADALAPLLAGRSGSPMAGELLARDDEIYVPCKDLAPVFGTDIASADEWELDDEADDSIFDDDDDEDEVEAAPAYCLASASDIAARTLNEGSELERRAAHHHRHRRFCVTNHGCRHNRVPKHAHPVCSPNWRCTFSCNTGYQLNSHGTACTKATTRCLHKRCYPPTNGFSACTPSGCSYSCQTGYTLGKKHGRPTCTASPDSVDHCGKPPVRCKPPYPQGQATCHAGKCGVSCPNGATPVVKFGLTFCPAP